MRTIRKRPHKTQYVQRIDLQGNRIEGTQLCATHFKRSIYDSINARHEGTEWVSGTDDTCHFCETDFS